MDHSGRNSYSKHWAILYHPLVKRDIKRVNKEDAQRIKMVIERKLGIDPLLFGSPLHGTLKKYFKHRVGDWRII